MLTLIEKRKEYREWLEVEIMKIENDIDSSDRMRDVAKTLRVELDFVANEIKDIENGIEKEIDIEACRKNLAEKASKYYREKLKTAQGFEKRCDIINTHNFWALLKRRLKGENK